MAKTLEFPALGLFYDLFFYAFYSRLIISASKVVRRSEYIQFSKSTFGIFID